MQPEIVTCVVLAIACLINFGEISLRTSFIFFNLAFLVLSTEATLHVGQGSGNQRFFHQL
jgi:hypothetical protein